MPEEKFVCMPERKIVNMVLKVLPAFKIIFVKTIYTSTYLERFPKNLGFFLKGMMKLIVVLVLFKAIYIQTYNLQLKIKLST